MNTYVLMHFGFEKPTPEFMSEWKKWFASIQPHLVEMGNVGFRAGREISSEGSKDLPLGPDSVTGFSVVRAESLDHAERLASTNPYVKSIRIYEAVSH
jgi:hypothetical protein